MEKKAHVHVKITRKEDMKSKTRSGAVMKWSDSDMNKIIKERNFWREESEKLRRIIQNMSYSNDYVVIMKIEKKGEENVVK